MVDKKQVMSWLEGLTFDDWHMYHSDSEVQEIAKVTFELLKEQEKQIDTQRENIMILLNEPRIVRCKDCKYGLMMENGEVKCDELCTDDDGYPIVLCQNADWYCADGERRDG
jgi:hypothetical protein